MVRPQSSMMMTTFVLIILLSSILNDTSSFQLIPPSPYHPSLSISLSSSSLHLSNHLRSSPPKASRVVMKMMSQQNALFVKEKRWIDNEEDGVWREWGAWDNDDEAQTDDNYTEENVEEKEEDEKKISLDGNDEVVKEEENEPAQPLPTAFTTFTIVEDENNRGKEQTVITSSSSSDTETIAPKTMAQQHTLFVKKISPTSIDKWEDRVDDDKAKTDDDGVEHDLEKQEGSIIISAVEEEEEEKEISGDENDDVEGELQKPVEPLPTTIATVTTDDDDDEGDGREIVTAPSLTSSPSSDSEPIGQQQAIFVEKMMWIDNEEDGRWREWENWDNFGKAESDNDFEQDLEEQEGSTIISVADEEKEKKEISDDENDDVVEKEEEIQKPVEPLPTAVNAITSDDGDAPFMMKMSADSEPIVFTVHGG